MKQNENETQKKQIGRQTGTCYTHQTELKSNEHMQKMQKTDAHLLHKLLMRGKYMRAWCKVAREKECARVRIGRAGAHASARPSMTHINAGKDA